MKKLVASGSQNVARLETATVDYVGGIGYDEASVVYLYDPYRKFYETYEEMQKPYEDKEREEYVPPESGP